jgi:hypothetical protein
MARKLSFGEKHLLRLIAKDSQNPTGWAPFSSHVYSLAKQMPDELVECFSIGVEGKGEARLTAQGQAVLAAMEWL